MGEIRRFLPLDKKFPKWELGLRTSRSARRTAGGGCLHIEPRRHPKLGRYERESEDGAAEAVGLGLDIGHAATPQETEICKKAETRLTPGSPLFAQHFSYFSLPLSPYEQPLVLPQLPHR